MKVTAYETEVQKVHRKQVELENAYLSLANKIEKNSEYIGKLNDIVNKHEEQHINSNMSMLKKVDRINEKISADILLTSERVAKYFSRMEIFELSVEASIKNSIEDTTNKNEETISAMESIQVSVDKTIKGIESKMLGFLEKISSSYTKHAYDIDKKTETVESSVKISEEKQLNHLDAELKKFRNHYINIIKYFEVDVNNVKKSLEEMQSLKEDVKEINVKAQDVTVASVNERLNNFMDDVNKKLIVKKSGKKTDVLKRLALLEGVKDSIDHRKSSKEVLKQLEEAKLILMGLERVGDNPIEARAKVEILEWILGRTKNGSR